MKTSPDHNNLIIILRNLRKIHTGGQYRLAKFVSFIQEHQSRYEIIDCESLNASVRRNRFLLVLYFIKYFAKHRRHVFLLADNSMHMNLLVPFFICRFSGNRYAVTCLQTFYNFRKNFIMKWLGFLCEFLFLQGASCLMFPSEIAVNYFKPFNILHKRRAIVNPAPKVTPKRKVTFRNSAKKLLYAGQVRWWKGLDILIRAFILLKRADIHLDIAGSYDENSKYFANIKETIIRNGIEQQISFHGILDKYDLARLYSEADIFILPSRYETYGIVLLEAMAFGLPVIASTIPSAIKIVKENVNGIFYETENPESLANALLMLISDRNLRRTIHTNNINSNIHSRTWETVSSEYYQAIERFL